jgi:hypothetical protein
VSCQQEETEITNTGNDEVVGVNSNLILLLEQMSGNDGSLDDLLDNASCIEINLPVTVTVNGSTITINNLNDISLVEENIDASDSDDDDIQISFPIIITLSDYTDVVVNSEEELLGYVLDCFGEDIISCVDFQYPISFSVFNTDFQNADTVTIGNDEALYEFLLSIGDSDGAIIASLNYPIVLEYENGDTVSVNSNQELEGAISNADQNCSITPPDICFNTVGLSTCDGNGNGVEVFDLTMAIENCDDIASYNVAFYETESDAINEASPILDPTAYSNTDNPQTIYYRASLVSDPTIFEIFSFTITVEDCCDNPDVLIEDLVIYMPFSNEFKDIINDFSIDNPNGSFVEDRAGNPTCAYSFVNADALSIPVTDANQIVQGDSFSISVWFKMQNTNPSDVEILFQKGTQVAEGFELKLFDLNAPYFIDIPGYAVIDSDWNHEVDVVWTNDDWHHLVATVDEDNTVRLYRDGTLRDIIQNSPFYIGDDPLSFFTLGQGFTGHIDDLRVYKKALNPTEINQLLNLDADCFTCL